MLVKCKRLTCITYFFVIDYHNVAINYRFYKENIWIMIKENGLRQKKN